jgi:hypothetical protein
MGLIRGLLTAPIALPARSGWWVIEQIVGAAEADLHDEGRLIAELRALAADADAGHISEEEHAAAEAVLLERLVEARAWRAGAVEETS